MRKSFLIAALALILLQVSTFAQEREYLWGKKDAYIEWLECSGKRMADYNAELGVHTPMDEHAESHIHEGFNALFLVVVLLSKE